MAPHSSTLAWKIPWMEEPHRLQSMGSLRVGLDWVTSLSLFTFMHWRRKWQPTPVFLPGESQGWGSLVGCRLWGCTESDTTEAAAAAAAVVLKQNFQPFLTSFWVLSESKEIFDFSNSDVNRYDKHVINCSFSTRNSGVALLRKSYCALFSESSVFWNLYSLKISQVFY